MTKRKQWMLRLAALWVLFPQTSLAATANNEQGAPVCAEMIPAVQALEAIHNQEWDLGIAYAYWAIENNPLTPWAIDLAEGVLQESNWPEAVVETNRRHLHQARMQVLATGMLPNIGSGLLALGLVCIFLFRRRLSGRIVRNVVFLQALVLALSLCSVLLIQAETLVHAPLELGLRMMPKDHAELAGTLPAHTLARIEDRRAGYLLLTDGNTTGWAREDAVLTRSELRRNCQ